jgi:hypothetical protein
LNFAVLPRWGRLSSIFGVLIRRINKEARLCSVQDAPLSFVPKRWSKYFVGKDAGATVIVSRPAYELALLTTLNERIKSGDVTLVGSRRWGDFEDCLIPVEQWERERTEHYRVLQLPIIAETSSWSNCRSV